MDDRHLPPRSHRIWGHWPIATLASSESSRGMVRNLSCSGLFFVGTQKYQVGDVVDVEIWIGGSGSMRALIKIVRQGDLPTGDFGYGARFAEMDAENRRRLRDHLNELRQAELAKDFAPRRPPRPSRVRHFKMR
jgi:hypothetical protein